MHTHRHIHWGILIAVSLLVGNFLIGQIKITYNVNNAQASARSLLTASDFTYLGYFDIYTNGSDTAYAEGLAHRYVNGDLRFLMVENGAPLAYIDEFSLAGKNYGDLITST